MFRFLKAASIKANNVHLSRADNIISGGSCKREDILTGFHLSALNNSFSRHLSTEELTAIKNAIKKRKKLKRKYAELVEIKENRSSVKKAVVRNLSPQDVSRFTQKPEISLENVHLSINKNKTKPAVKIPSEKYPPQLHLETKVTTKFENEFDNLFNKINLSSVNNEDLEKKIEEEIEWKLIQRNTETIDMFSKADMRSLTKNALDDACEVNLNDEKLKTKEKSEVIKDAVQKKKKTVKTSQKKHELKPNEKREMNIAQFQKNLALYMQLCVTCDLLDLALKKIQICVRRYQCNSTWLILNSAEPFNILIHGFAKKGDIDTITKLMNMMKSCDISLTPQTFAGCFECFSWIPVCSDNAQKLETVLRDFKYCGFTFQDLFSKCSYLMNEREYVLKTINRISPDFVPFYESPTLFYCCQPLQKLNENMNSFRSPAEKLLTEQEMDAFAIEQGNAEIAYYQRIKSVHEPAVITDKTRFLRKKWAELQNHWSKSFKKNFLSSVHHLKQELKIVPAENSIQILYPSLLMLAPDDYVNIVMNEIRLLLEGSESFSPPFKFLCYKVGERVKYKCEIKFKDQNGVSNKIINLHKAYCKLYLDPKLDPKSQNPRQQWQRLLYENANSGPSIDFVLRQWSDEVTEKIGQFLLNIAIKNFRIDRKENFEQAFHLIRRYRGEHDVEEFKIHQSVISLYRGSFPEDLFFPINVLPMLCPPIPWNSRLSGGYLYHKVDLIRIYKHFDFLMKTLFREKNVKFYPVFDSLNQLSSVPWKINKPILDIMLEVFQKGGSDKLNIPKLASSVDVASELSKYNCAKLCKTEKAFIINKRKEEMHSLWCEMLYRLSLANHYRDRIFWLPHNTDFRGRVYPTTPHLSHIGSDSARSLLQFAKGEKLGAKGFDWLKIHCINLTGLKKKASLAERLAYANKILPDILDSAEKPLTGRMWWTTSEDIWQTLACCMEIKAVYDSGDPENFISHFPVHQDGSCNGLQHYAALGRDQFGGESVNLIPSPVPQDVYSSVVALVERQREKDANMGSEVANVLKGFVERKVIKQTIMTTVYGVTRYGARLQIQKQLKEKKGFPPERLRPCSQYLAETTFDALRQMFTSAKEIQDWFTTCAETINEVYGSCVEWRTPLDFYILQAYLRKGKTLKPNGRKQKNAFPPNFVHSLDSSHMMLTSINCERNGITFVSVHDCFWTHASSVDLMNKICREQFVVLHSQPILEKLSEFFIDRYTNGNNFTTYKDAKAEDVFRRVPKRGTLDLMNVLNSEYFFS